MDFQSQNEPVILVDTKKKELIGDFKNSGTEWCEKEQPIEVKMHDFVDPKLGKAIPYGIYDLTSNQGWVNVGIDHDTAEFAALVYSSLVVLNGKTSLSNKPAYNDYG